MFFLFDHNLVNMSHLDKKGPQNKKPGMTPGFLMLFFA
ncbi:hypothetical protein CHCC14809_3040 [Bacillus licheniformis]|nr:hypothetical protein CHCC15087_0254 [Bacillus licheniformis]TWM35794.1 hypothetical protein CHCC14819_0374 [Bacillus licheniformis]TWM80053.1 hypothetical protein CHCC14809_3040 [Bacillus licheniformis]TWN02537.1 hypothetical protein CHCC14596_0560 [Bacillus licheniformis]TWO05428.1 hypothetical protein CHCC14431_3627 [Bacillus licheniformis]